MTGNTLQTLDRGIRALKTIAANSQGISVAGLATDLGINRAIAYRLVATLELHGWVARTEKGEVILGAGLLELETGYQRLLREKARIVLESLARQAGATAFLSIAEGDDCVAIAVAEPDNVMIRVGYRLGSRHSLQQGAAGIAILSARAEQKEDSSALKTARQQGYSVTSGELQKGAIGLAAPLDLPPGQPEACLGVVAMEDFDQTASINLVLHHAAEISWQMS